MPKRLRYSKVNTVERVGVLLLVEFLDDDQNLYNWAPKWGDVEKLFWAAINIERFNKPEGKYLNKLAQLTEKVVETAQRINSAKKLSGYLAQYKDQLLIIEIYDDDYQYGNRSPSDQMLIKPAFDVTVEFLGEWLNQWVEILVINEMALWVKKSNSYEKYPPEYQKESDQEEPLPF